ncbi:phage tail-collar fiber domain-containing protein [Vibrio sp. IB15]|uniref:phage tail-collar fiber domain-containing protein n=1 Tax=Vibrio sp. IB15 TaxID=2779368 RepID=UPI001E565981|nr:phage tail protein [Vibrio sp. IB15]
MANTTDKSILTAAGKALLAQLNAEEKPLIIDKMIFANVPNRPEFPQPDDVVPTDHVVHQEGVEQRGRLSADSVIYSTTLTSDVGPFEFNWTGAYCSEYGVLVTIDHHALTPKSADEPGVAGNTLVRSVVLEYKDIAEITNITVDASSWQYNATPRMKKMDDDAAQAIIDQNGKDWFIEDGFLVTPQASAFNIKAGAGYVSGNRVTLEFDRNVQVPNKPSFIYVDAHREGTPIGEQVTLLDFVITAEEKDDYIDANGVKHFVCKIAQVLADGSVSDLRPEGESASRNWTQQNTVISVDTFADAFNSRIKAKRLRTNYHTNFGTGASEYLYIDTDTTKKSQGDEYEFWNESGHHYRLNHNRTVSIEQFGAVDDSDIMPVLAKVLPLFKQGVLRIKSEGGDYRLAPGNVTVEDFSSSELDFRKANLRIDESLDKSSRISFVNPTSLEIKLNEVDYEGKFSHRLFYISNPLRLRVRVYDEIKNACYPSPDYVVDNLSAFMIVGGGVDIRIKFTEFFNMYHKNYDGTLVDRAGTGGEHLGRCISVHKTQGVASKRLKLSGGAVTECRTPFVFDGCDNLTANSIDFTQLSDNAIYDLGCNNTVYDDMTFVDCQDEGIVFNGVNKKFTSLRFYNVINKCMAISGSIKAVVVDNCSFRANVGDMPLNAIKTRVEVEAQSSDLTVSNCYFEGRIDYAVNYLKNIDKISFNNKCRFKIEDNTNGRVIATFGNVNLLEIGNCDFDITGSVSHYQAVQVTGSTKLRTYDNEGLLESYLSYPDGAKLPVEFRDKNNVDPSLFTTVEEHKGNMHLVAPITDGLEGRGYAISFAFDANVNSHDEIKTGGFLRVVKSDSNNVEADCRFEFWSAKSDKTGYQLIGVIDNANPLLPQS